MTLSRHKPGAKYIAELRVCLARLALRRPSPRQEKPRLDKSALCHQCLDGEGAGGVVADHLGTALHIGRSEIGGRRMIRQNSQPAGPGRRIRERQAWRGNRPGRCRTGGGHDCEGERRAMGAE